jgi:hypothetical protein
MAKQAKQPKQAPVAESAVASIMSDDAKIVEYHAVCSVTIEAVSGAVESDKRWKKAAPATAAYFGTPELMLECKVQFMADAIVPGLSETDREALKYDGALPRKGSKAFKELSAEEQSEWERKNTALRNARAARDTKFSRLMAYAFPKPETETAKRDLAMRIIEECTKLHKACEKSEDADFNVIPVMDLLQSVIDAVRDGGDE